MTKARIDWMGGGRVKLNGTVYEATEIRAKKNGQAYIVWPLNLAYAILTNSITVKYSSGTKIAANASNYAYITATVQVYRGETLIETRTNEVLTITAISDTEHFEIRDGNKVYGKNLDPNNPTLGMGAISFPDGLTCQVTNYGYANVSITTNNKTIEQSANVATATGTEDITTAFEFSVSASQFYHNGGTIAIYGTQTYNVRTSYSWTSGAPSSAITSIGNTRSHAPDILLVTPEPKTISSDKTSVEFAANNGSSDITYQIIASLDGKAGTQKNVVVKAAIYTYSNLQILSYSYPLIAASGGSVYPNAILFSIDYAIDGVSQGTLSGAAQGGATSATASNSSHSVTGSIGYMRKVNGSWVADTGNGLVTATTRGHNEDSGNTTDTVTYPERRVGIALGGLSQTADTTAYQQRNYKYEKSGSRSQTSYSVWLSTGSVTAGQNTIYVYGRAYYSFLWAWVSGAPDTQGSDYSNEYPTAISTSPDVGSGNISVANHSVTIPANNTGAARSFRITGSYGGYSDYDDVDQEAVAFTYGTPRVSIEYDTIGAAGGTFYPVINFSQDKYQGSTKVGTITGQLSNGATIGTASDGSSFSLTQISGSGVNGSFGTSNAGVTIGSRGTTEGSERVAARYIYVKLKCHDLTGDSYDTDGFVSCNQAANYKGSYIDPVYTSVRIVSLSKTSVNTCAETAVTASVKATWTDGGYKYSAFYDGDTTAYTGLAQHNDESVTGTNGVTMRLNGTTDFQNSTNEFKVSNLHSTSSKTHSVVAVFGGKTSSASSVTQAADSQSDWLTRNYAASISIASNNVTAAGGSFTVSASGSHVEYKKWNSDNEDVSGTVSTVSDTPTLSLVDISSSGVFTLSGSTVTHRDMTNNATTDSVKVRATNGSATADTSAVSVTNSKTYGSISLSASTTTIPAGMNVIYLTASCDISWTSGYPEQSLSTADFEFSFVTKGNNGKRTYSFEGIDNQGRKVVGFGSLGTNLISTTKDTTIRVSHSSAGTKDRTVTENANTVDSSELVVDFSLSGAPISGAGGSVTVGVSSAKRLMVYSSGASNQETISAASILGNTTVSAKKSSTQTILESIVFRRSSTVPSAPSGGSYSSPVPTSWSDGIPSGSTPLWMSRRIFASNGSSPQQSSWSTPVQIANVTGGPTYSFSAVQNNPGNPTGKPANWHDTPTTSDILMAVKKPNSSVWEIMRIKGENATGFSYSYSSGASYLTVSAIVNEGYEDLISRFCNLTTIYSGKRADCTIEQSHVFYATKVITDSGVIKAYVKNIDSGGSHSFTYVVSRNGVEDTPVTASFAYSEGWRQVGGMPSQAGNQLSVIITAQDGTTIIRS